jgi:hypothetical protein
MKSGLTTVLDDTAKMFAGIELLTRSRVMVGVPAEKADRRDEGKTGLTNAALAYIHTNGAPEINLPPRPFLQPGIERAKSDIEGGLKNAGQLALAGNIAGVEKQLEAVGLLAVSSVRSVIVEGIPPPLAESTVERRIARRKSKKWRAERRAAVAANVAAGAAPGAGLFVPLVDTSQLLKSITHVLRKVGKR